MKQIYATLTTVLCLLSLRVHAQPQCGTIIDEADFDLGVLPSNWIPRTNLPPFGGTNGLVNVVFNGLDFDLRLGALSDGALATHAVDWIVDLSAYSGVPVDLRFQIYNFYDETQVGFDGIWLAPDTNTAPVKVFDFNTSDWGTELWGRFPPINITELAQAAGISFTSTFVIRFQQAGQGDFNGNGSEDGIIIDNVTLCARQTNYATIPYFDDFDSAVLEAEWHWSFPNNDLGSVLPTGATTTAPSTPAQTSIFEVARIGVGGFNSPNRLEIGRLGGIADGVSTTSAIDLHLDLAGYSELSLTFDVYSNGCGSNPQDALFFSQDGGQTFVKVYEFNSGSWAQFQWGQFSPIQIHTLATSNGLTLTNTFVIRFQHRVDSDFDQNFGEDGFLIDNVSIIESPTVYQSLPYCWDFEGSQSLPISWSWEDPRATVFPDSAIASICQIVDVQTGGFNSQNALALSRSCENAGLLVGAAADLHLDLSGTFGVSLDFMINDVADEPHPQDGLWFSNDGGLSWGAYVPLDAAALPNFTYTTIHVNVDSVLAANSMSATNMMVVRFQEYDDADFDMNFDEDGFRIDDVCITGSGVGLNDRWSTGSSTTLPNPTSGALDVLLPAAHSEGTLLLLDPAGRITYQQRFAAGATRIALDLSDEQPGLYLLDLRFADGTRAVERVVRQ